ncbi:hypothetical protein GCM10009753_04520 [Streptantibioticus ferralitis]
MLDAEDNQAIGSEGMTRDELVDACREIYPPEKEALGVLAIHLQLSARAGVSVKATPTVEAGERGLRGRPDPPSHSWHREVPAGSRRGIDREFRQLTVQLAG